MLDNNLINGKLTYDKSFLDVTVKIYAIKFNPDKIQKVKEKLNFLMKRKDLEFEVREWGKYKIYEDDIYYSNGKLFNEELVDENLAIRVYKNPDTNIEENLQKLGKIFRDYEDKCRILGIPTMIEIFEHRRNKRFFCL